MVRQFTAIQLVNFALRHVSCSRVLRTEAFSWPSVLRDTAREELSLVALSNGEVWLRGWLWVLPCQRKKRSLPLLLAGERIFFLRYPLACSRRAWQSERPSRQYTWCVVLVLWEIVSKKNNYHLIHTHRPIAKYIKVPIAK